MKLLQTWSLVAAALTTGLMAGLFAGFAYGVMPGLSRTDDRTFISAMQKINVAIVNGWFMISFMGALFVAVVATVVHWRGGAHPALPWVIAGLVLYALMFLVTVAVNVPLNDQLAAAGDASGIGDPAAVRERFEGRWVAWNIVRAVAATAAFACFAWALVVNGEHRDTATGRTPQVVSGAADVSATGQLPASGGRAAPQHRI